VLYKIVATFEFTVSFMPCDYIRRDNETNIEF